MHGSLKFHLQLKTKEDMEVGAWDFKGKNGSLVSEHLLGQLYSKHVLSTLYNSTETDN